MRTINMKLIRLFLAILAVSAVPTLASAQQMESHIGKVTGHSESGKQLFYRYCWGCHGFRGDGNGEKWLPTASFSYVPHLNIPPRNFISGNFKGPPNPT